MYDLTALSREELDLCAESLKASGAHASSMEEAANRITRHLYDNAIDPVSNQKACVLVRMYKTHSYENLNAELRGFAQGILGHPPESPDMKCLILLASSGDKAEWNTRTASYGHKAIPLPDEAFVSKIPMISRLVNQFGLDVKALIQPDPNLITDLEQKRYNAFHVAEAVGSPYIPAQKDFVVPLGIRSVLGFGGMLTTGELFALIMFAKVRIPRATADMAKTLALAVKSVVQPFAEGRIFAN